MIVAVQYELRVQFSGVKDRRISQSRAKGGLFLCREAYYPPRVQQYREDGARHMDVVMVATLEGKKKGRRQALLSWGRPRLLGIGFVLQLPAAFLG